MPRPSIVWIIALLAAFVSGVVAGDYLAGAAGSSHPDQPDAAAKPVSSADTNWSGRELEEFGLKDQAAEAQKQLADMKAKDESSILNDRLAFYKKYKLAPTSFSDDLKVTDEMAEFLKMSDAERKDVEAHLAQIHEQIQALEKQHLKLVTQTDNSFTYEIEPFPEGTALKDQLNQYVQNDLGAERGGLFMDSAVWEMNRDFAAFGVGKTGLQVTRTDQSGPASYRITETFANGSSMSQTSGSAMLPAEFRGLVQLDTSSP